MQVPGPESLQIMGYILLSLALPVLAWAVLGDPSRGRLRCPKCWYRMEGIPKQETGWVCPECGRKIAKERGLRRARRRWRWAVPALLAIVVASQLWQQPARANERWQTRWIPATALVIAPTRVAWLAWVNEAARARERELPYWIWLVIDWNDWRHATAALRSIAYTRARWPVGVAPVVWFRTTEPADGFWEPRRIEIELLGDLPPPAKYTIRAWRGSSDPPVSVNRARVPQDGLRLAAAEATGTQRVPVRIRLDGARGRRSIEQVIEYTATATVDEALPPRDWPGAAEEIRAGTTCQLARRSWYQRLTFQTTPSTNWSWLDYRVVYDDGRDVVADPVQGLTFPANWLVGHARLVVYQDPALTLQRYPAVTSYWPGRVEIPFSELLPP